MASHFSAKIHEARHTLTTQLIQKILDLECDDDNFVLAHDFCLQKEYYHSFGDVKPSAVEAVYADVVQRLHQDSQPSKAAALSALTSQLLAVDLQCKNTLDLNHNLLQLLASLAGQPLESELEETPQLLHLLYKQPEPLAQVQKQQQTASVSRFKQLLQGGRIDAVSDTCSSRADSEADEYDPYGDESDLTSWATDDEQEQHQQRQAPVIDELTPDDSAKVEAPFPTSSSAATSTAAVYRPPGVLQAPKQLQPCRATPSSSHLLMQLANKRLGQLPFLWPDRAYCFTEQYLAQQLMQLMQGQQAHGFLLSESQAGLGSLASAGPGVMQPCFVPDPRVTTPGLSPAALHAVMSECAAAGSAARQLRKLAAQLTQSRGKAWLMADVSAAEGSGLHSGQSSEGSSTVTSCLRAFGVALQLQLNLMGQQIVQLQQQAASVAPAYSTSSRTKPPGLTLLTVKQQMRPIMHRLQLLHKTVSGVLAQLGGCPADVSATLLDGLCEAVHAAAIAASGEQGVADAAALLQLLLCSCVPLVAALAQWLWCADDGAGPCLPEPPPEYGLGQRYSSANGSSAASQPQSSAGVNCCCEDFFVVKKAAIAATDARFWHAAYGISKRRAVGDSTVAAGGVACPSFLLPLVDTIMEAGKGVRLLDYMEQEQLRHTSFCSSARRSAPAPAGAAGVWLGAASTGPGGPNSSAPKLARSNSSGFKPRGAHTRSSSISQQRGLRSASSSSSSSLSRQPSAAAKSCSARDAALVSGAQTAAAAAVASDAAVNGPARKQLDSAAAAAEVSGGAAGAQIEPAESSVTRQVRLQLAVAAAAGSHAEQDQLPQDFIQAASNLLQQQQQQQSSLLPGLGVILEQRPGQPNNEPSTALQLMQHVLESAGNKLANPCAQLYSQASNKQHPARSLREALLAAKQKWAAQSSQVGSSKPPLQHQPTPELPQLPGDKHIEQQLQTDQPSQGPVSSAVDEHSTSAAAAAPADADTQQGVPPLLQWRDQLEARLTAAGTCLQNMAPWQQQRLQQSGKQTMQTDASSADCDNTTGGHNSKAACGGNALLQGRAAASHMPGSFSASLAELWPLQQQLESSKCASAAIRKWATHCSGSSDTCDTQQHPGQLAWLAGGAWHADQLAWLLLEPPRQLLPLPQLLEQALLQPIQERLDLIGQQLLSSLMGEWGLLQQLQGLAGVFLLASPTMVEWSEGCFAAVEAAAAAKRAKNMPSSSSTSSSKVPAGRPAAVPTARGGVCEVLGIDEVDVFELELLLHDLVSSAEPAEVLPDPSCLHISLNTAALADLRAAKQKQQAAAAAATVLGSSTGQSVLPAAVGSYVLGAAVTGGLWGCTAEWAGLSCQHSGTWQLSLLYEPEELDRFSMAWRFLLQLRWVRRRLDGARHAACKGAAALRDCAEQDSQEQAAVAAALQAVSRGLGQIRATDPATGPSKWLSSRQELLLLQEMGQLLARWQQYVMERLLRTALPALEQALLSAGSLDEVRAAAGSFLCTVSNLCNARPSGKGAGGTWRHVGKVLGQIMDSCLAAAAAAGRLRELRAQLAQPGLDAAGAQCCWLELSGLRCRLSSIASSWRSECGYLLRILSVRSLSVGDEDDLEALLGALDANGYYQRLAGLSAAAGQ